MGLVVVLAGLGGGWLQLNREPAADTQARLEGEARKAANRVFRPLPAGDESLGLLYGSLEEARSGPCLGAFKVKGRASCSHGPDPVPVGLDPSVSAAAVLRHTPKVVEGSGAPSDQVLTAEAFQPSQEVPADPSVVVPCLGDGRSGSRIKVLYVHGSKDRFAQFQDSVRAWAAGVDKIVMASAVQMGGSRHVLFETEPVTGGCQPVVTSVTVPDEALEGDDSFTKSIDAVSKAGFGGTESNYLMFTDANVYCGISELVTDDTASSKNLNNRGGRYARVDSACWNSIAATHQLFHTLGAVQPGAPHATAGGHCTDEYDVMCYSDADRGRQLPTMQIRCPSNQGEQLDCGHDDYFSAAPAAGSYLATHWNTADSVFLSAGEPLDGSSWGRTGQGPGDPGRPKASEVDATSVALSWRPAQGGSKVLAYDVYSGYSLMGSSVSPNIRLRGLTPATSYRFLVKARDAGGRVSADATLDVKTAAGENVAGESGDRPERSGTYTLVNLLSGQVLDTARQSTKPGEPLIGARQSGASTQRWELLPGKGKSGILRNVGSGLCLTSWPGSRRLTTTECESGSNRQMWRLQHRLDHAGFALINMTTDTAVGYGNDRVDGVRTLDLDGRDERRRNQVWVFVR